MLPCYIPDTTTGIIGAESSGVWVSTCVLFILITLNSFVVWKFHWVEKHEVCLRFFALYYVTDNHQVYNELTAIAKAYEEIVASVDSECTVLPNNDDALIERMMTISSGHSQVSIVACYRSNQWVRIPILLLAEGDIIALMAGGTSVT